MLKSGNWRTFRKFTVEYGVARGIPGTTSQEEPKGALTEVQTFLANLRIDHQTPGFLESASEELQKSLKKHCENGNEANSQLSLISKVLSMSQPEKYPMWDRFARLGLRAVTGKSYQKYDNFKSEFDDLFGDYLPSILSTLTGFDDHIQRSGFAPIASNTAFQRRIFDVALMIHGKI